jgi:hypothetical protein
LIGVLFLYLGYQLPQTNFFYSKKIFEINYTTFFYFTFGFFCVFVLVLLITAPDIPIVLALKKEPIEKLVDARETFLKARTGFQIYFKYINIFLVTSIIPYVLVKNYEINFPYKNLYFFIAYLFSLVFLEKVFFLKFLLPLTFFSFLTKNKKLFIYCLILFPLTTYTNTYLSGFGSNSNSNSNSSVCNAMKNIENYYSASYAKCVQNNRLTFITWRVLAVPVFSASDSFKLFNTKYNNKFFLGKTSQFLSFITSQINIKFENQVFISEWGDTTHGTGSSNSNYTIEQFINFGWLGVIISSFIMGILFKIILFNRDLALISLLPLILFQLFLGGVFPVIFSSGILPLLIFLLICKFKR